jgi:hypothetical protein
VDQKALLDKVKKVVEYNQVHYFYWPVEIGINPDGIKIGSISIPTFPKLNDYEPVKITNYDGKIVVLSRFRYRLLTYFNQPYIKNGRAIIRFISGSHSPIAYIDTESQLEYGANCRFPPNVDSREISAFRRLRGYFEIFCTRKINFDIKELEDLIDYQISDDILPKDVIFTPEKMIAILWIGTFPDLEELKVIGYMKEENK